MIVKLSIEMELSFVMKSNLVETNVDCQHSSEWMELKMKWVVDSSSEWVWLDGDENWERKKAIFPAYCCLLQLTSRLFSLTAADASDSHL